MASAPWQDDVLAAGELYEVGGNVRDRIFGFDAPPGSADDDYVVTGIAPDALESILIRHGSVEHVGKHFGVFKFTPRGGETVDIVYPRVETSTGAGHRDFEVRWDWTMPVEKELARRDFTINAIAVRVRDGEEVDPCGGRADIASKTLRMIFPAAFEEDALRILRGVRFAARFGLDVETSTWEAMRAAAGGLNTISPERVQEEFTKLFATVAKPSVALGLLLDGGGLEVVLPELARCAGVEQNVFHPDDVFWHCAKSCDATEQGDVPGRWAALLHDIGKVDAKKAVNDEHGERVVFYGHEDISARMARGILTRLRYPNDVVESCVAVIAHHMYGYQSEWKDATVRRFVRRVGEENLDALFRLRYADCMSRDLTDEVAKLEELKRRIAEEREAGSAFSVHDLAIGGHDVMDMLGIGPGPEVGSALEHALESVLETPGLNNRDELKRLVGDWWAVEGKKNRKPR